METAPTAPAAPTLASASDGLPSAPAFAATVGADRLTVLPDGADRLAALLALIDGARHRLRLCFYIFAADASGGAVLAALARAARRGVRVDLIIDSFGSGGTRDAFFAPLRDAGGHVCCFSARASVRYLIRNHQKMLIADDAAALIGGFNIADDYFAGAGADGWLDLGVRIDGPTAGALARYFDRLNAWTRNPDAQWRAIRRLIRGWDAGDGPVRLLLGGPTARLSPWARCVSTDLRGARRLDMVMAYFSPAQNLLRRIGRIARPRSRPRTRRGGSPAQPPGRTRLVMAARSDNGATIGAARLLYGYLLKRGAEIHEYRRAKLHTKLIVLDDAVYLGSANFDMRSLYINAEIMLRVEDAAFADRMRAYVDTLLPDCDAITPALHRRRASLFNRIRWTLSWFVVAVVDYTVTRRLNFGLGADRGEQRATATHAR